MSQRPEGTSPLPLGFAAALAWTASGQLSQSAIGFVSMVVLARLLLPQEIGVYALALSTASLLGAVRELGSGTFLIQKEELRSHDVGACRGVMILLAGMSIGACLLLAPGAAAVYATPELETMLPFVALHFLTWPIEEPARALLARRQRFDLLQRAALLATSIGAATSIALAAVGVGPIALAWGLLARSLSHAVALASCERATLRATPSLRSVRAILAFGGLLATGSVALRGSTEGRKLLLGSGLGLEAVAWLERAISLPATVQRFVFAPLNTVLLPRYAQRVQQGLDLVAPHAKVVTCGTVIAWPIYLCLGLVATPVVVLLFGEPWRDAGRLLVFVLVARALAVGVPGLEQVLVAHGRARRLLAHRLGVLAVTLPVVYVAVSLGLTAFGVAIAAIALVSQGLALVCLRFSGIGLPGIARAARPALPITLLSAVPLIAMRLWVDDEPGAVAIGLGALGSAIVWLVAVYAMRGKLPPEVDALRAAMLGRLRGLLPGGGGAQ